MDLQEDNTRGRRTGPLFALGDLVELAPAGDDRFVSLRCPGSRHRLYGSGILAASLLAAAATADPDLVPASISTMFLRSGRTGEPVEVDVDRLHDGRTTCTRVVTVRQTGTLLATSIVRLVGAHEELGWNRPITNAVDVATARPELAALADMDVLAGFEVRAAVDPATERRVIHPSWIRHRDDLPDDQLLHACMVAFLTDQGVSGSTRRPGTPLRDRIGPVTLDHSIWFHRPVRADRWLLITAESLSEAGGRALARGEVTTEDGRLVVSFTQQAMLPPAPSSPTT